MTIAIIITCLAAIVVIIRHGLPARFPWTWALAFLLALLIGSTFPLGTPERFVFFGLFLASVIVGARLAQLSKWTWIAAAALALFIVADALRIIPTPDITVTAGETFGILRRPYYLSHPNIAAAWSLLLPFNVWTIVTVTLTQSRSAFLGLMVMGTARYIPRRLYVWAIVGCLALLAAALIIRPGTAFDRLNFWREGIDLFLARPFSGWGSGSYVTSLKLASAEAVVMNMVTVRTGMHTAHNALITIASENGLMGLVPFIGLVISLGIQVRRSKSPAKWGLLAFAVQQLFDDQWLHPITSILLGVTVAMALEER